ncbi:unnamed protein product [Rotaria sp. Silwood2]|nr:unnamed protein product [Rotaria sp. Silwood2]CAF4013973.1 unnamed protein product [Rotaria sp. Silwood2]
MTVRTSDLQICKEISRDDLFVSKTRNLLLARYQSKVSSSPSTTSINASYMLSCVLSSQSSRILSSSVHSNSLYKDYVGIVKDATEAAYKIEFHAKCQTIIVDRNRETSHYITIPLHGSQTPSYAAFGSRTSMIGNQNPMHDASMTQLTHGVASTWDPTSTRYLTNTLSSDLGNSNSTNSSLVITSDSGLLFRFTNGQKINSNTDNA